MKPATTCSTEGCDRPVRARGMCRRHWERTRQAERGTICAVDGCEKLTDAASLCNAHYLRKQHHGDPSAGKPSPRVLRAVDHDDGTRTCAICGERKPLSGYHADQNASLGRRSQCKDCRAICVANWYERNQERQLDRARVRYQRDIETVRENDRKRYYRDREKRIALATESVHVRRAAMREGRWVRGITLRSLRKRDGDECCYCGITMLFEPATGHEFVPGKATIEHIISISAGGAHDWDNTALSCWQCNLRKNKTPLDEWLKRQESAGVVKRAVDNLDG